MHKELTSTLNNLLDTLKKVDSTKYEKAERPIRKLLVQAIEIALKAQGRA